MKKIAGTIVPGEVLAIDDSVVVTRVVVVVTNAAKNAASMYLNGHEAIEAGLELIRLGQQAVKNESLGK